ncbi:MAG: hypothetical protein KIT43_11640 [Bauldia sp.]|nr:hypothetical protein [Bauldia sp.]MCW5716505.1 hypothetical protein [Bauldia sp.]
MRNEVVEVLSDRTNAVVLRHPGRAFPGVLVQGDSLHGLCQRADSACEKTGRDDPGFDDLNSLRNALQSLLTHYKATLAEHNIALPFSEEPLRGRG